MLFTKYGSHNDVYPLGGLAVQVWAPGVMPTGGCR
jgi:hypothetical protein